MQRDPDHFDILETRDPEVREQELFAALPGLIAQARENTAYFARMLAEIDPEAVTDRTALATLPVTRKSDLIAMQQAAPPFGGLIARDRHIDRIFQSPGPIHEPQGQALNYWRAARALHAAGFAKGDLVHNAFSYHLTPGGWILDDGARALGCTVFPAGTGQTDIQARAIAAMGTTAYCGTPSFLLILLEKCAGLGLDHATLTKALVSGEALPPSLRHRLDALGVTVRQAYATADVGIIAYESPAMDGLIVDESVIVEIVRPGTGDPVAEGEVGEVLVTSFTPEYPLLRFATGDLSAVLPGVSPCGRTNMRITGWKGRADQTTKVKGMFVHPEQVAEIVTRHPEILRARLIVDSVDNRDIMTLKVEPAPDAPPPGVPISEALAHTLHDVTKLRGTVETVPAGSLPNDGKVIDDVRTYE